MDEEEGTAAEAEVSAFVIFRHTSLILLDTLKDSPSPRNSLRIQRCICLLIKLLPRLSPVFWRGGTDYASAFMTAAAVRPVDPGESSPSPRIHGCNIRHNNMLLSLGFVF